MANLYNNLNLIDLNDYSVSWWEKLLDRAHKIMADPSAYAESCKGKISIPFSGEAELERIIEMLDKLRD